MTEGPTGRQKSLISGLRERAGALQKGHSHRTEHTHHEEEHAGAQAALLDLDEILKLIEKKMRDDERLAEKGKDKPGQYILEIPNNFKTKGATKYKTLINNSSTFISAYGKALQKALGPQKGGFFVHAENHHGKAFLRILWSPSIRPHDH